MILRELLSASFFPFALIAATSAAVRLQASGASAGAATALVLVPFVLIVLLLEQLFPFDRGWNRGRGDLRADVSFAALVRVPESAAAGVGHVGFVALTGLGTSGLSRLPWGLQLGLILLAADLGKYLLHRRGHVRPSWWRFHSIHHAPERIYVLNGLRLHPINLLWNAAFDVALPIVLGVSSKVVVIAGTLRGVVAILQHANLPLRFGPLNYVFSTNELHRYHHSIRLEEGQRNYGSTFIVWDLLFGTYRGAQGRARPAAVGLGDAAAVPRAVLGQLLWPFCGAKLHTTCFSPRLRALLR